MCFFFVFIFNVKRVSKLFTPFTRTNLPSVHVNWSSLNDLQKYAFSFKNRKTNFFFVPLTMRFIQYDNNTNKMYQHITISADAFCELSHFPLITDVILRFFVSFFNVFSFIIITFFFALFIHFHRFC